MIDHVIIMAGGAGKRLWPASTEKCPKQFLKIKDNRSLFRDTLDRAFMLEITGKILIVTHENHIDLTVEECRSLPRELREKILILGEPIARNTAPALALAAQRLSLEGLGSDTALIMAADHLIDTAEKFRQSVEKAAREAKNGELITFGIVPHEAATGYGYIEVGSRLGEGREVLSFKEKPDAETAVRYLSSGRHFWNTGLFAYRHDSFLKELAICAEEISQIFSHPSPQWFSATKREGISIERPSAILRDLYQQCPALSIDYAVMEKTEKIRMIEADFEWNDLGTWDVLSELKLPNSTALYGYEEKDNFVYADCPVALCGVENLIVVVSNGKVMVCRKGMSQYVKNIAEKENLKK